MVTGQQDPPRRVALFATCMSDFAAPGPASAAAEVLRALGCSVELPTGQSCCGQPAYNSGYRAEAVRVAEATLDALAGYDAIVSPSGSCVAMLREELARAIDMTPSRRRTLDRMYEFTQFVVAFGESLTLRYDATVTYHDSCHMTRILGERSTPRQLLDRIEGVRLIEMTDSDTCCGFGGTFSVKFPDLSTAMADVKLTHEAATGAQLIVASDPGCLLHQKARADATGRELRFVHIAELTRDALQAVAR